MDDDTPDVYAGGVPIVMTVEEAVEAPHVDDLHVAPDVRPVRVIPSVRSRSVELHPRGVAAANGDAVEPTRKVPKGSDSQARAVRHRWISPPPDVRDATKRGKSDRFPEVCPICGHEFAKLDEFRCRKPVSSRPCAVCVISVTASTRRIGEPVLPTRGVDRVVGSGGALGPCPMAVAAGLGPLYAGDAVMSRESQPDGGVAHSPAACSSQPKSTSSGCPTTSSVPGSAWGGTDVEPVLCVSVDRNPWQSRIARPVITPCPGDWEAWSDQPGTGLGVLDWCVDSVRQHPLDADTVVVCRGRVPIASIPKHTALWWRACVIREWMRLAPKARLYEYDVAVAILQAVMDSKLGNWKPVPETPFRGDRFEFMPWDAMVEVGPFRPASLPIDTIPRRFDRSTSAFTDIRAYGSPLSYEQHRELIGWHPDGALICNNIRWGHSLMSSPPVGRREAYDSVRPEGEFRERIQRNAAVREAVGNEVRPGAFIELTLADEPDACRFAPFIVAPKPNGKWRGIGDMSFGEQSVNACTNRQAVPKTRLASLDRILQRITWMRTHGRGRRVVLAKIDASRAFRQAGIPERDFRMAAHRVDKVVYLNTRLMMGAAVSGDMMGLDVAAIRDTLAREGIYTEVFVDDQMIVMYEDEAEFVMKRVKSVWEALGWPLNEEKFAEDGIPSRQKVFLGLSVDVDTMTVQVDHSRREKLVSLMKTWLVENTARSVREYRSLAGKLQFVAGLIPFGKVFMRALFQHAYERDGCARSSTLPVDIKEDLVWWVEALDTYNGAATFGGREVEPAFVVATDASGYGYGVHGVTDRSMVHGTWTADERRTSSTAHWEGGAIVIAVAMYGAKAEGGVLLIRSDSIACVKAFNRLSCRNRVMHELMRTLAFLQLRLGCRVLLDHISGVRNVAPDWLSRKKTSPMPPDLEGAARRYPLATVRQQLGEILCSGSSTGGNTSELRSRLPSTTLLSIASASGTQSRTIPHWTALKTM